MFSHLKKSLFSLLTAVLATALFVAGCSSPTVPASIPTNPLDMEITIKVSAVASPIVETLSVVATNDSNQSFTPARMGTENGQFIFKGLTEGKWTFTAEGSDANGITYYRGQVNLAFPIQRSGAITPVEIRVQPVAVENTVDSFASGDFLFLKSGTTGASIIYTTDGTDPSTTNGNLYEGGILMDSTITTVKAVAIKSNRIASPILAKTISFDTSKSPQPVFSPLGGNFQTGKTIPVTLSANGATIYYTTDGTTPDSALTGTTKTYTAPINLTSNTLVRAIAVKPGLTVSAESAQSYSFSGTPDSVKIVQFSLASNVTYTTAQTLTLSSEAGATIKYTTQVGSDPVSAEQVYNPDSLQKINLSAVNNQKTIITVVAWATATGKTDSTKVTTIYTIDPAAQQTTASPVITVSPANGNGSTITFTLTGPAGATILYALTEDGSTPGLPNQTYSGPITLSTVGVKNIAALAQKTGETTSATVTATGTVTVVINQATAPSFDKAAGDYTADQTINLSAAAGANIYYTLDGSNPSDTSTKYTGALTVTGGIPGTANSTTIKAIAYETGKNPSTVVIKTYNITYPLVPAVSAVPETGTFTANTFPVTLNASTPASGTYSLNGGTATAYTNGTSIDIGTLPAGTITLVLKNGTATKTLTYTKQAVDTGFKIYYKSATAPKIWTWEGTGVGNTASATDNRAICTLEGQTWPGPALVAATGATGWFVYEVPAKYLPLKQELNFHFNGDNTKKYTRTATGWYDPATGLWTDTNPDNIAKVPTITLQPNTGFFATSQAVTITVTTDANSGPLTAATYTLNGGAPVNIVNGTASFTINATTKIDVSATNSAGTATATGTITQGTAPTVGFSWDNATVYFVITDRFNNGDTTNDTSYGRVKGTDATGKTIGTFHGGDIKGLKAKLDANYFTDLGINAIWMTAPYEQMHGFVGGGTGDFAHYAYHGYYALDYSNIDKNMGTKQDFKDFVDAAHAKGIRVILDIVMNHSGYLSLQDMADFNMGGKKSTFDANTPKWTPGAGENWSSYHDKFIDYTASGATGWGNWWGGAWVRAGLPGYPGDAVAASVNEVLGNLASLPDFRTENTTAVGLPTFLKNKADYGGAFFNYTVDKNKTQRVRDWEVEWLSQWVREYGIDGFRCDTAKHVEMDSWAALKTKSDAALKAWRAANPTAPGANWTQDFWTTAEVFDHGMTGQDGTFHGAGQFDSLINFGFMGVPTGDFGSINSTYASYAQSINANKTDKWNYLSFIDNHDKGNVFFNGDAARQIKAGTALLLAPGGIQIFYGDEYGRINGDSGSDKDQGSRSDYNWSDAATKTSTLDHWKKIGSFRARHVAIGGGDHASLTASSGTAFSRIWNNDKVAVVMGASGSTTVTVSAVFADGTAVKNAYDGTTASVSGGKVTFNAGTNGVILIEAN